MYAVINDAILENYIVAGIRKIYLNSAKDCLIKPEVKFIHLGFYNVCCYQLAVL